MADVLGTAEVLVVGDDDDAPRRLSRRLVAVLVVLALVAASVAGLMAYRKLSGGGAQPETVVPARAAAYAEVDLDPPAAQKIAGARFLRGHAAVAQSLHANGDVGRVLLTSTVAGAKAIDFDRDIKPWAGDRAAVALVPNVAGTPMTYEIAFQVKDSAAAKRLLPRLAARSHDANVDLFIKGSTGPNDILADSPEGWVIKDGYAILAPTKRLAQALADEAAKSALASNATYVNDLAPLGPHVASLWIDTAGLKGITTSGPLFGRTSFGLFNDGRTALVVHFVPGAIEVVGSTTSSTGRTTKRATQIPSLPPQTAVALEVSGAAENARRGWAAYAHQIDAFRNDGDATAQTAFREQFGLQFPQDLEVLLGNDFVVTGSPVAGNLHLGARAVTSASDAEHLVEAWRARDSGPRTLPLTRTTSGVAWTDARGLDVTRGTGALGSTASFNNAFPGYADASWAFYLNANQLPRSAVPGVLSQVSTLGVMLQPQGDVTRIYARLTVR